MQHVLSARQFEVAELDEIFEAANEMQIRRDTDRRSLAEQHVGTVVLPLFYEPSTRTRLSFASAAAYLGIAPVSTENAKEFSSAIKGESLKDTIRTVEGYCDVIVLRHNLTGAADEAAAVSTVPVINAGDGTGEHPTQSLLDLYTIQKE